MSKKLSILMVIVMLVSIVNLSGIKTEAAEVSSGSNVQLEDLDRGLVAAATPEGIFLSWRLLSNEVKAYSNYGLRGTDFNVYRDGEWIAVVDKSTNFLDVEGINTSEYYVSALVDGVAVDQSKTVTAWENSYYDLPIKRPEAGVTVTGDTYEYHANDMSVGDVNGDGQYEYIVKWDPTNSKDVSQVGYTGKTYIDTYTFDGTLLYRIDLGVNIRSGAHYTQFLVYDFDGDGKSEMMFKTAPGTKLIKFDETGNVASETFITMPQADVDAGYSHNDDYRLSSDDYYNHLVDMFMGWHEHEEVAAGNWPRTLEESFGMEVQYDYPLAREDAESLVDYFMDVYAPARSGRNDLRNFEGFILHGPEYLTVFNGETGAELETIHYKPGRGDDGLMWGDYAMSRIEPGNRVDRFLAGVAYLDGQKPSAVFARGYYTRTTLVAYDWNGTSLNEVWFVDSGHAPMSNPFNDGPHGVPGTNPEFASLTTQGFHSLSTADVDGDGKQEIIYGSATIDHDGSLLYSSFATMPEGSANPGVEARLGHGDAMHVADIDPDRPGLEIFSVHEGGPWAPYGYALRDASTGEVIYGDYTGRDTGRGMIGDVVRGKSGLETWAVGLWTADGENIGSSAPGTNMNIKWSADMTTQIINGSRDQTPTIEDWENGTLLTAEGTRTNNYTKGNPSLVADVFGDWREELLVRTVDSSAIRIYLSTEVTDRKLYTLMHDIQYRTGIAWQNTGYNQPAYPSFYFASDMNWANVSVPNAGELPFIEEEAPEIDVTELEELIATAKAITNQGNYTDSSYQSLQDAIAAAEAALETIESETELYVELAALQEAIDGLEEIVYLGPGWRFDFGSATSPVANGYTQVTDTMIYDEARGYGFAGATDGYRDQEGPDDLRRDFILAYQKEFMVDLPDGEYDVVITTGSQWDSNTTSYTLEGGESQGGIRTAAGEFMEYADTVTVSDGQLNIVFSGQWARINGVEIIPAEYLNLKFDFGSETSPVADDYLQVTNTMIYDEERGYGLSKAVAERDRGGPDDVRRDFVINSDYAFRVDLSNGDYFVRIIAGDDIAFNRSGFTIEGVDQGNITSSSGNYAELTAMTTVSDGQLNIDIRENGRINGLEIVPISNISSLAVDNVTLTPEASVALIWEAEAVAAHYEVYRKMAGDEEFTGIGSSTTASFTDETAELSYSYTYAVTLVTADGIESERSNEVSVDMIDESVAVTEPPTGLQLDEALEHSVTFSWEEVDEAIKYYVYRSRFANERYARIGVTDEPVFTDDTISTYSHFYYKVRTVNEGGISDASEALESPITQEKIRRMEKLNRALVAVETEQGIYVGWRMLGTDPEDVSFDLYRDGGKVNETPISMTTNYLDTEGSLDSTYRIKVNGDNSEPPMEAVNVWNGQYLSVPLDKPTGGVTEDNVEYTYIANDASVGDVDGDGEYEIILKWEPSNAKDNSRGGYTGNVYIDAYELDGTKLWRIDAGKNIRAGAHYTQFLVYDFDGNGKSEVVFKTADGTVDGEGTVIGDADADWRNGEGRILDGAEYLTIFEGETGKALDTIDYYPPRGNVSDWGDGYGNRVDRFLAGVAYLDGEQPSIVMARGYYTRTVLAAYNFSDGELTQEWVFDSDEPGNEDYAGQGNHSLAVADVDGDTFDEIIYGASVIDHDGKGLYSTGWGHGDALHVSDLNPNRGGLEIYQPHESAGSPYGYGLRDAETGESLWGVHTGTDVGRGLAADIDPRHDGAELWASNSWDGSSGGSGLYSVEGESITDKSPMSISHAVWWDGDLLRELLDHDFNPAIDPHGYGKIEKWNWNTEQLETIYTPEGTRTSNHTKGNPSLQADLFGDWREEIIWASSDSTELQIHTTTDVTDYRIYTLMHDPTYRLSVAWQNVGYNQPPHTGFYLGHGMDTPSTPNIYTGDEEEPTEISIATILNLLEEFEQSGDVGISLYKPLKNSLKQAEFHMSHGREKQALKQLENFIKHLNNKGQAKNITDFAKDTLQADVETMMAIWIDQ
jgi:fibronectin type 3 domain-containing protein